jgi:hypothetical protein
MEGLKLFEQGLSLVAGQTPLRSPIIKTPLFVRHTCPTEGQTAFRSKPSWVELAAHPRPPTIPKSTNPTKSMNRVQPQWK